MSQPQLAWTLDPDDPRAPPQELWDRMPPAERERVLEALPCEFDVSEASPPEGDVHFEAVVRARDVLRGYFGRAGRRVWVANNLPVYYPAERMFSTMASLRVARSSRAPGPRGSRPCSERV